MATKKKSPKRSSGKVSKKTAPAGRAARKPSGPSKKAARSPARSAARPARPMKAAGPTRTTKSTKPVAAEVVHTDVRRAALAWSFSRLR